MTIANHVSVDIQSCKIDGQNSFGDSFFISVGFRTFQLLTKTETISSQPIEEWDGSQLEMTENNWKQLETTGNDLEKLKTKHIG